MCSTWDNAALPALGCPIRESADHRPFSASPRLIAAVHALHRLLVPRHPPCALTILTVIGSVARSSLRPSPGRSGDTQIHWLLCSSQGPWRGIPPAVDTPPIHSDRQVPARGRRSLKTQQRMSALARAVKLDRGTCQARSTFLERPRERGRHPEGMLPRKEVIQPQLPLRLPCYDFTPVTSPTFDGSLPCGLGHRLRVLLTPVV